MMQVALEILRAGGVVAMPTETVYGLAADITQPGAIEKIFKVKERPFFDPLIVHVQNIKQVEDIAEISTGARQLAEKFWPGPLTLILPKKQNLNPMITSGLEKVAVRCPAHPMAQELIRQLGHPVAAPSANKFGRTSPTTAEHVKNEFGSDVYVLDGGPANVGVESTVLEFNDATKEIFIYRPGAVTPDMLQPFGKVILKASPVAPGHLEFHYQPTLPVVWFKQQQNVTTDVYTTIQKTLSLPFVYPAWVHLDADPTLAARKLYQALRVAAQAPGANCIFVVGAADNSGLWLAIADRLQKASQLVF
jgi:L-threonylcarbamoyladenylate synthase